MSTTETPTNATTTTAQPDEERTRTLWIVVGVVMGLLFMFIVSCLVASSKRRKKTEGKLMAHGVVPKYAQDHKPVASSPSSETKHIPG